MCGACSEHRNRTASASSAGAILVRIELKRSACDSTSSQAAFPPLPFHPIAVQRSREIWVLPLPAGVEVREDALMVDVARGQPESLVKISTDGGFDPHWQGTDRVAYLRGPQRIVVSLHGGERRVTSLGLELPRAAGREVLALTNAQVLTMRGGRDEVLQDASVVIENARIRCVGDCDTGDAARVIDLEGRTIMPRWVDTHAHNIGAYDSAADLAGMSPMQRSASAAYLAYGVTTTYDPAASDKTFHVGELHGKGPHFEVWLHAEASSPLEAIRYATYNGAHFLGLDTDLGSLEEGKLADLVVLDGDPLENIRNTETISWVMKNGVLYAADTLDQSWPDAKPYGPRPWRMEYPESNGSKALPD